MAERCWRGGVTEAMVADPWVPHTAGDAGLLIKGGREDKTPDCQQDGKIVTRSAFLRGERLRRPACEQNRLVGQTCARRIVLSVNRELN